MARRSKAVKSPGRRVNKQTAINNYQSMIVGLLVFLVGLGIVYKVIISKIQNNQKLPGASIELTQEASEKGVHIVKEGETLWQIAENETGWGYKSPEIAKANKLTDPNHIEVGQKIVIPTLETPADQTQKPSITAAKYTVQEGDTLWDISIRAYGNGFRWPEIAKVNNIPNPDLIYVGNTLILPGK